MKNFKYSLLFILFGFHLSGKAQNIYEISSKIDRADTRFLNALPHSFITSVSAVHFTYEHIEFFNDHYLPKLLKVQHVKLVYKNENQLKEMLIKISQLPELKSLEFEIDGYWGDTTIGKIELPNEILKLKTLETLKFKGNCGLDYEKSIPKLKHLPNFKTLFFASNIKSFPKEIEVLSNLTGLELFGTKIKELPRWLSEMQNLQEISISGNQLDMNATLNQISKLKQLKTIIANYQILPENLDPKIKFDKLEAFYMRSGVIKNADVFFDFLSFNPGLKTLRLINTSIKNIPESIGNLKQLRELTINNTRSSIRIPENIGKLKELKFLDLSSDTITHIPLSIGKLKKLEYIDLNYTQLKAFPFGFTQLKLLSTLIMIGNNIVELPSEIGKLKSLKDLNISSNPLTSLPESIAELSNLERLDVSHANLSELPRSLGGLAKLKKLILNDNFISLLPQRFTQLTALDSLIISFNKLTHLPDDFGSLRNLKTIDFSYNKIQALPFSVGSLIKLEELFLVDNNLSALPESLSKLTSIHKLVLSNSEKKSKNNDYSGREIFRKDDPRSNRAYGENTFSLLPKDLSGWTSLKGIYISQHTMLNEVELFKSMFTIGAKNFSVELENANITTLPTEGWKNFNIGQLNLGSNKIASIPKDIVNAPYLTGISLYRNSLPSKPFNLNSGVNNMYQKLLWFRELGFINQADLPKVDSMALAYVEKSDSHYYRKEFSKMVEAAQNAIQINPALAKSKLSIRYLGEAKYETGDYSGAIADLTIAIKKDTAGNVRIMNFVTPDFEFRAKSYLKLGDTLSAIKDYETLSINFHQDKWGDVGLLYKSIGKLQEAKKAFEAGKAYYKETIDFNTKNKQDNEMYELSLLELTIIAEDFHSAIKYAAEIKTNMKKIGPQTLFFYLDAVAKIGANTSINFGILNDHIVANKKNISGWSFELLFKWLRVTKIQPNKTDQIRRLTDAIK